MIVTAAIFIPVRIAAVIRDLYADVSSEKELPGEIMFDSDLFDLNSLV